MPETTDVENEHILGSRKVGGEGLPFKLYQLSVVIPSPGFPSKAGASLSQRSFSF